MKRMGKRWNRLHRLVYLAGVLVILHYAWSLKGNLFSLQGDVTQPIAFGLAVVLLLVARSHCCVAGSATSATAWQAAGQLPHCASRGLRE